MPDDGSKSRKDARQDPWAATILERIDPARRVQPGRAHPAHLYGSVLRQRLMAVREESSRKAASKSPKFGIMGVTVVFRKQLCCTITSCQARSLAIAYRLPRVRIVRFFRGHVLLRAAWAPFPTHRQPTQHRASAGIRT